MTDDFDNEHEKMVNLLYMWRNHSLKHMTPIVGFIKTLLEENPKLGNLTPEQRNFLEIALRNAGQSKDWWNIAVEYTKFHYKIHLPQLEPISIYSILDEVKFYAKSGPHASDLSINIPDNLPMIKGNIYLGAAISYIIFPEPQISYRSPEEPYLPRITVYASINNTLTINIWTDLQIDEGKFKINSEEIFHPGGYLSTAEAIIEQFSELRAQPVSHGIEFEFTVPLWEGS